MQVEESAPLQCAENYPPDSNVVHGKSLVIPSSSDDVVPPQPAKRPTRQWAAWTWEEEESFFNALRQVGKNFEKITYRVRSKNKDQVRHYYYRLVRRMNKLLGPGLSLDAKNSKDTNAAMLRWWSLLEKYSCKASKLHLKPRRFKIFVDALEHQLSKDRKKNARKRSSQAENNSLSPTAFQNQNQSSGNDTRAVKVIVIDNQNIQKAGQGKGSSTRCTSNMGVSRSSSKGDFSVTKSRRQHRKSVGLSAAAMKRWEKAAMAGVSLVADAAEHLERSSGGKEADHQGGLTMLSVEAVGCSTGHLNHTEQTLASTSERVQPNSQNLSKSIAVDNNVQTAVKLQLQLFPIDESTRKALEMDKHNPHLELTLSVRKKISSILEHLDRKWGCSSVASGELMLFPFSIQRENLSGYRRWTRDSLVTAAEVYAVIGSPPVFRLRYGWISSTELQSATSATPSAISSGCHVDENKRKRALMDKTFLMDKALQTSESYKSSVEQSLASTSAEINNPLESPNLGASMFERSQACDRCSSRKPEDVVDKRVTLSAGEWADSLTNVSVGDLLTEISDDMDADCVETPVDGSSPCLEEIPFTCDSFDAAIAAHISSENNLGFSGLSPHSSSILNAEETCDAFSFQKRTILNKQVSSSSMAAVLISGKGIARTSSAGFRGNVQGFGEETRAEDTVRENPMGECPSEPHEADNSAKNFSNLTDIYWPDSLGPLELDVPPCKYYSEDLIFSDSLSGLNRLIASSLDAFQNCSFLGLDDKQPPSSAAGAQASASFAGKIGKGDNSGVQSLQV